MNNARTFSKFLVTSLMVLSACAPAATPASVAREPYPLAGEGGAALPQEAPAEAPATGGPVNPVDNFYQDYGVNPVEDAENDHLSTFAIDVDTASYSVTRRYLEGGSLPPFESVRAEEFINAFDYAYPNPEEGETFGVLADGAANPFSDDGMLLARFGIQGRRVAEEDRKPTALTFVIDVSGSMDMDNRLGLVKQALGLLVDQLDERDTVAIVVYGSDARVVLEPTSGEQRRRVTRAIEGLRTEGATNVEDGLRLGYQLALEHFTRDGNNRLVLCSDGVANVGVVEADQLLEEVRGYVRRGIFLTTVGFGMGNFNDTLMEQLADGGDGFYAYVDDIDEARKVFVEDLTATLEVIAKDAKIQVDFNPEVVSEYRLIGYENREIADEDYFDDSVDAGEVGAGHAATALYAIRLRSGARGEIATLYLTWKDPQNQESEEISHSLYTEDLSGSYEDAAPSFQLAVVVGQFAEVLRESPDALAGSLREVNSLARKVERLSRDDEQVREFTDLTATAARLAR